MDAPRRRSIGRWSGLLAVLGGVLALFVVMAPAGAGEPGPAYPPGADATDVVQAGDDSGAPGDADGDADGDGVADPGATTPEDPDATDDDGTDDGGTDDGGTDDGGTDGADESDVAPPGDDGDGDVTDPATGERATTPEDPDAPDGGGTEGADASDDATPGDDGDGDDDVDIADPATRERTTTPEDPDAPDDESDAAAAGDVTATGAQGAPRSGGRGAGPYLIVVATAMLLGGGVIAIARRI